MNDASILAADSISFNHERVVNALGCTTEAPNSLAVRYDRKADTLTLQIGRDPLTAKTFTLNGIECLCLRSWLMERHIDSGCME